MSSDNVLTFEKLDTDSIVLGGQAGQAYIIPVRVRGVFSTKTYTGGTRIGKYVLKDATPAAEGWDVIKLTVSAPSAIFYLNAGVSAMPEYNQAFDYWFDLPVNGGATVTLSLSNEDYVQYQGDDNSALIPVEGFDLVNGIWLQVDYADTFDALSLNKGGGMVGLEWRAQELMVKGGRGER